MCTCGTWWPGRPNSSTSSSAATCRAGPMDDGFGDLELSAGQAAAALSGDPRLEQLASLQMEESRLQSLHRSFTDAQRRGKGELAMSRSALEGIARDLPVITAAAAAYTPNGGGSVPDERRRHRPHVPGRRRDRAEEAGAVPDSASSGRGRPLPAARFLGWVECGRPLPSRPGIPGWWFRRRHRARGLGHRGHGRAVGDAAPLGEHGSGHCRYPGRPAPQTSRPRGRAFRRWRTPLPGRSSTPPNSRGCS